jgi:hypothetical protein
MHGCGRPRSAQTAGTEISKVPSTSRGVGSLAPAHHAGLLLHCCFHFNWGTAAGTSSVSEGQRPIDPPPRLQSSGAWPPTGGTVEVTCAAATRVRAATEELTVSPLALHHPPTALRALQHHDRVAVHVGQGHRTVPDQARQPSTAVRRAAGCPSIASTS